MTPNFASIVTNISNIVDKAVIPLLFALAFVYFLINIVRYFFIHTDHESREKGRQAILYGLIGLAVLFSVWGIVNILLSTLTSAISEGVH